VNGALLQGLLGRCWLCTFLHDCFLCFSQTPFPSVGTPTQSFFFPDFQSIHIENSSLSVPRLTKDRQFFVHGSLLSVPLRRLTRATREGGKGTPISLPRSRAHVRLAEDRPILITGAPVVVAAAAFLSETPFSYSRVPILISV